MVNMYADLINSAMLKAICIELKIPEKTVRDIYNKDLELNPELIEKGAKKLDAPLW